MLYIREECVECILAFISREGLRMSCNQENNSTTWRLIVVILNTHLCLYSQHHNVIKYPTGSRATAGLGYISILNSWTEWQWTHQREILFQKMQNTAQISRKKKFLSFQRSTFWTIMSGLVSSWWCASFSCRCVTTSSCTFLTLGWHIIIHCRQKKRNEWHYGVYYK